MKKNKFYFADWYLRKQTGPDQMLLKSDHFMQQVIKQTAKAVLIEISKTKRIEISGKAILQKLGSKLFWVPKSAFFKDLKEYTDYLNSCHLTIPESMQIERVQNVLYAIAAGEQKPYAKVSKKFKNRAKKLFESINELKSMQCDYSKREEFKKKMIYKTIEVMIKEKEGINTIDSKMSYILENQLKFFNRCKLIVLLLKNQEKRDEREGNTTICNPEVFEKNKIFLQNCGI